MLTRFWEFLPSLFILSVISVLCCLIILEINWYCHKKGIICQQNNFFKFFWLTEGLHSCVLAPAFEEMIFRLPLIIIFSQMTVGAWIAAVVTGIVFGAAHWFNYPGEKKIYRFARLAIPTILGVEFAYLGIFLQTVWVGVLIHSIWNLCGMIDEYINIRKIFDEQKQYDEDELLIFENSFPPKEPPADPTIPGN